MPPLQEKGSQVKLCLPHRGEGAAPTTAPSSPPSKSGHDGARPSRNQTPAMGRPSGGKDCWSCFEEQRAADLAVTPGVGLLEGRAPSRPGHAHAWPPCPPPAREGLEGEALPAPSRRGCRSYNSALFAPKQKRPRRSTPLQKPHHSTATPFTPRSAPDTATHKTSLNTVSAPVARAAP